VDIRLISSFTAEDEDLFAPVVLNAIAELLDKAPVAYSIRVRTTAGTIVQHSGSTIDRAPQMPRPPNVRGRKHDSARR
jgi:hypothetical protein